MNAADLDQFVSDVKPELRAQLIRAFRNAAGRVDRYQLADALAHKDREFIRAVLGISADGTNWADLETEIRYVLASTLAPLFSASSIAAWEALDATGDESDTDPAAFDDALTEARTVILADALGGIDQAITLILAGTSYGLGVSHLLAAIGITSKQAQLFIAANRNAVRLGDALARAQDDAVRTSVAEAFLAKLPTLLQSPLRKLLAKGNGQFSADDVRVFSKNLSRGLVEYHANAVADVQTVKVATLAELAVWKAAQQQRVIPSDAKKYWITRHDERVRHTHAQIETMNAGGVPVDATFVNPLGLNLVAPPAEVNCRCRVSLGQP
jgi:hypothetical protein